MKKAYWIIIGAILTILVATMVWTEWVRARSQDVTIAELILPLPDSEAGEIVLLEILNDRFRDQGLPPVHYYQGFQVTDSDGQIMAGNFSYSQIDAVRSQLDQISDNNDDITLIPVLKGWVQYDKVIAIRDGVTFKVSDKPYTNPVVGTVELSPGAKPLIATFYDGHTILFARTTNEELRILFITSIFPPESKLKAMAERIMEMF